MNGKGKAGQGRGWEQLRFQAKLVPFRNLSSEHIFCGSHLCSERGEAPGELGSCRAGRSGLPKPSLAEDLLLRLQGLCTKQQPSTN